MFHNHTEDGLRYKYPLIQYKRIHGYAAIVCIGDGTDTIGEFFNAQTMSIHLNGKPVKLHLDTLNHFITEIRAGSEHIYQLHKWLPFNQNNHKEYAELETMSEKITFLERLLTGNILSFAKGIGIHIDYHISVSIIDLGTGTSYLYKGVPMLGFELKFKTNILLPEYIGLGKGVSLGFGTITSSKTKSQI